MNKETEVEEILIEPKLNDSERFEAKGKELGNNNQQINRQPITESLLGQDKMKKELGMLQEKINSLEQKLKKTNCIGFDPSCFLKPIPLNNEHQKEEHTLLKRQDKENVGKIIPRSVSTKKLSASIDTSIKYQASFRESLATFNGVPSSEKNQVLNTSVQATAKKVPGLIKANRRNCTKSAVKANKENKAPSNLTSSRRNSVTSNPLKPLDKKFDQTKMEKIYNAESNKDLKQMLEEERQKKEMFRKEADKWKKRCEKLQQNEKQMKNDYAELEENYKSSEEIRKQQRKKIRELEEIAKTGAKAKAKIPKKLHK